MPIADSGVPKLGEPDCMSVFERNEPSTTGQPGRMSSIKATPDSASAVFWARVAGVDTGDIAPIRRNGVTMTGWFARAYSKSAASILSSYSSGELTFTIEMTHGVSSIDSRPKTMSAIARVSRAFGPDVTEPMNGLSDEVNNV